MTGRDVTAGLLVAAAVVVWLVGATTAIWPVDGVRQTTLLVTALGVAAATVGATRREPMRPAEMRGPAALGLLAALAAVTGLLTGSAAALAALVLLLVSLWMLATLRHALSRRR